MTHGDTDVSMEDWAAFAARNQIDFHDGDKLKMNIWVGNNSAMEQVAEIEFTGNAAEAIVGYDHDAATDHDRDTFLLEAIIDGLQRELERRMQFNYDQLPEAAKAVIDGYSELAEGRPRTRSEERGICCAASRDGGEHDHGTFVLTDGADNAPVTQI